MARKIRSINRWWPYRGRLVTYFQVCQQIVRATEEFYNCLIRVQGLDKDIENEFREMPQIGADNKSKLRLYNLIGQQINKFQEGIDLFLFILVNIDTLILKTERKADKTLKIMKKREKKLIYKLKLKDFFEDDVVATDQELKARIRKSEDELTVNIAKTHTVIMDLVEHVLDESVLEAKHKRDDVLNVFTIIDEIPRNPVRLKRRMKAEAIETEHIVKSFRELNDISELNRLKELISQALADVGDLDKVDNLMLHYLLISLRNTESILGRSYDDDRILRHEDRKKRLAEVREYYKEVAERAVLLQKRARRDIPDKM